MARHCNAAVTCSQGDFEESGEDVQSILADAAMHAVTSGKGHVIHEHINDDREVEADWTADIPAIYAEGGGLPLPG